MIAGVFAQIILLPAIAFALISIFQIRGEIALGIMILGCCPGGVTSNVFTKFAKGDVALSISYTAIASILTAVTLPVIIASVSPLLIPGIKANLSTASLSLKIILIATVPVLTGLVLNTFRTEQCRRWQDPCGKASNILVAVIISGAVLSQWSVFSQNAIILGPVLLSLNLAMLATGLGVGQWLGLDNSQVTTLAIESGFQNGSVGIVVGSLISTNVVDGQLSTFSLPSAVYGVLMLLTIAPFVVWRRSMQAR